MNTFPDWEKYAVVQRDLLTGCIPTGYEMLLRAAGFSDIDYQSFQDEFDLDKDWKPGEKLRNNFSSVANVIRQKYPNIGFKIEAPTTGQDKLKVVEHLFENQHLVLVSLARKEKGRIICHIMPVIGLSETEIVLLERAEVNGDMHVLNVSKSDFIRIHDTIPNGHDIAYLE
jgi:hypothetical protein